MKEGIISRRVDFPRATTKFSIQDDIACIEDELDGVA